VFGAEGLRTSGRRFRVAGSPEPAGYASPAGEDARWKGQLVAGFRPAFPSEGVDLRLRDAAGEILHQRRFRPDSAYTAMSVRVVRAQDGTGIVILPFGTPNLPDGEITAVFNYRRDNLAPQVPVFGGKNSQYRTWAIPTAASTSRHRTLSIKFVTAPDASVRCRDRGPQDHRNLASFIICHRRRSRGRS
jgi:hypothetical protein